MGAIGRKLGNSITTAGKVLPGAVNNTSVSGVTALPSGIDAGSMVLLSTQTASSSSSISFTSGIDSTYKEYMFVFNNIHPATDNVSFTFQGSTDGGSTYGVTLTSAGLRAAHREADTDQFLQYADGLLAQSTSYEVICQNIGADNDQCISGTLRLFNPSSDTYVKHFLIISNNAIYVDMSDERYVGGYFNSTSAINAIDFKMSSGNIDAGTIQMFGVK